MNLCCKTYSLQGAQGTPLQTQSVHTVLTAAGTDCKCVAGSGMPLPYNGRCSSAVHAPPLQGLVGSRRNFFSFPLARSMV